MPIRFQKWITRADLRANPDCLFVFGDNVARVGKGGQAREMRGEPNAVGVATKWSPSKHFSEDRSEEQKAVIDRDLERVRLFLTHGGCVVWPEDGIGTGLAGLSDYAPTTLKHVEQRLQEMRDIG